VADAARSGCYRNALESFVNLAAAPARRFDVAAGSGPAALTKPPVRGTRRPKYFSAGTEGALIVLAAAGISPRAAAAHPSAAARDRPFSAWVSARQATAINSWRWRWCCSGAGRRQPQHHAGGDGKHLMTDVWTSIGVVTGVALVFATGWLLLDPLIALAVAAYIILDRRRPDAALGFGAARRGDFPRRAERDHQAVYRVLAPLRHLVPRAAHPPGRRPPLRVVSRSCPRCVDRRAAHRLCEEIEARVRSMVPHASVDTHIEPISDPASYEDQGSIDSRVLAGYTIRGTAPRSSAGIARKRASPGRRSRG